MASVGAERVDARRIVARHVEARAVEAKRVQAKRVEARRVEARRVYGRSRASAWPVPYKRQAGVGTASDQTLAIPNHGGVSISFLSSFA